MKSAIASLAVSLVLAAAPLAVGGCAANEGMSTVEYPPPPVGYDAPQQTGPQGVASSEAPEARPGQTQLVGDQQYAQQQGDLAIGVEANAGYADTDPAALADFRQPLEPYGTWADDAQYGTVWTPSSTVVGSDFAPYVTAGHWTYDNDYTWVSDYDWGWAPYHYGRWVYIGARGWSWIPGRTYAGAWVTWRTGYDDWGYVGWAPLPPTWYWRGGYAVGIGFVPAAPYVFCSNSYLFTPGIPSHIVTGTQVGVVASHTRPYVPATPVVASSGHIGAQPVVGGPSPHQLGLSQGSVPRPPGDNRGLQHAQQFAQPGTAQSLGARPPQHFAQAASTPMQSQHAFAGATGGQLPQGAPRTAPTMPTLGGRNAPVASSPQYHGVQPTPYRAPAYSSAPSYSHAPYASPAPTPYRSAPQPYYGGSGHASAPSYSSPSVHSAPSYSAPAFHSAPSSAPSFHSAPSYSAPSFSAPSHSYSRPSVGGGGFHGGGGGVRSGGRR